MGSLSEGVVAAGLDSVPIEVAVLDAAGTIVLVNDAWRRFADANHGTDPDHWLGENYLAISREAYADPLAARAVEGLEAILAGDDGTFLLEYPCHSAEEHRWFVMEAAGFDADGERYAVVAHYNVTDRKLAELRSTAREQQLETLLGVLTHDLRNPLNVIEGYAELLSADLDHAEEADRIRQAAIRISEITEATLAFTQSGALSSVVPVRIDEVAREAWRTVATGDATLTVHETPTIHGDRRLLLQLFENLFRNAVTYAASEGGRAGPGPAVTVGTLSGGFYIEDDGPGVPPGIRDVAVRADFSTQGVGGLGLAIVQTIVEAHGGTLTITDAESGGARFEIRGVDVAPD